MKIPRGLKNGMRAALGFRTARMAEALGELTTPTPTASRILESSHRLQMGKVSWFNAINASPSDLLLLVLPLYPSTHLLWRSTGLRLTVRLRPCHFITSFLASHLLESMIYNWAPKPRDSGDAQATLVLGLQRRGPRPNASSFPTSESSQKNGDLARLIFQPRQHWTNLHENRLSGMPWVTQI